MPVLDSTRIYGRVAFLCVVYDREEKLSSDPIDNAKLSFEGMDGECHGGLTRSSCSRVSGLYPKGTMIKNSRQLSVMSHEEIAEIAKLVNVSEIKPEWFGVNIVFENIPNFTDIPPASRLVFESGASIVFDMENAPCVYAAQEIASHSDATAKEVLTASKHKRGLVGAVEAEGEVAIGMSARLFVPKSRPYPLYSSTSEK